MTNPPNPFQPAIDALEKDLAEAERHMNGLRTAINVLRAKAGLPPRPEGGGPNGNGPRVDDGGTPVNIKHDTFFSDKMGTAARRYLEMRYQAVNGTNPAKPREIFDALKVGGFQFETKDDQVAMISLRNMLRKNSLMFLKLPNGTYGLRGWYPGAKKPKAQPQPDDAKDLGDEDEIITVDKDGTATVNKTAAAS